MKFKMPAYKVLEMRENARGDNAKDSWHDMMGKVKLKDGEVLEVSFWSGVGDGDLKDALDYYVRELLEERHTEEQKAQLREKNRVTRGPSL